MKYQELEQYLHRFFPHTANDEQAAFFGKLAQFIFSPPHECFLLTGYAGTGKTTLMRSVVETYRALKGNIVLLAPTGRAAKVLTQRSGMRASTIHRHIYMPKTAGGVASFALRPNKNKHTLYVIDEASMIGDQRNDSNVFGSRNLLEDLIQHVAMGHRCKLLFIGDLAQLPPVGLPLSPALDPKVLENTFQLNLVSHHLTRVIRQAES